MINSKPEKSYHFLSTKFKTIVDFIIPLNESIKIELEKLGGNEVHSTKWNFPLSVTKKQIDKILQ
jgi:hypothetical protein